MRQERTIQASIFDLFAGHEIGRELKAMSGWLDEHPALAGQVAKDLKRLGVKETGRHGLPAESALRCALLKQFRQLSYEELAFHLEDSASFRAFARLPLSWTPKKSVLHKTISTIRAETWEAVNQTVLASARSEKIETGRVVRLDSTVTAALMHEPRPPPSCKKTGSRHPVYPRQTSTGRALSRADWHFPGNPDPTSSGGSAVGQPERAAGGAVASQGEPLPAADRAHYRTKRATGVEGRTSAGLRETRQPVRGARRYHRQRQPRYKLRP